MNTVQNCPNCGKKSYIFIGNYNPGLENAGGTWTCGNCGFANALPSEIEGEEPATDNTYANSEALAERARLEEEVQVQAEDVTAQVDAMEEAMEDAAEKAEENATEPKPVRTFAKPVATKSTSKRK